MIHSLILVFMLFWFIQSIIVNIFIHLSFHTRCNIKGITPYSFCKFSFTSLYNTLSIHHPKWIAIYKINDDAWTYIYIYILPPLPYTWRTFPNHPQQPQSRSVHPSPSASAFSRRRKRRGVIDLRSEQPSRSIWLPVRLRAAARKWSSVDCRAKAGLGPNLIRSYITNGSESVGYW